MVGKYLSQNCLCVNDSAAVEALKTVVTDDSPRQTYTSSFNRSSHERRAFLKKLRITHE